MAFTIPTTAATADSGFAMKIKTGLTAGSYLDTAQRAVGRAGAQVVGFVNKAGVQAESLSHQVGSAWRYLTGKLG